MFQCIAAVTIMTRKNQRNSEKRKKGKIQIQSSDNIYSELISSCMLEIELVIRKIKYNQLQYIWIFRLPINYLIVLLRQLKNDK